MSVRKQKFSLMEPAPTVSTTVNHPHLIYSSYNKSLELLKSPIVVSNKQRVLRSSKPPMVALRSSKPPMVAIRSAKAPMVAKKSNGTRSAMQQNKKTKAKKKVAAKFAPTASKTKMSYRGKQANRWTDEVRISNNTYICYEKNRYLHSITCIL